MRVVKNKAKMERIYNFLGMHMNIPSVVRFSIYMMTMIMMIMITIIIIVIIMKSRNFRKQP